MDNVLPLRKKDFSFEDEIRELTDLCKEDLSIRKYHNS